MPSKKSVFCNSVKTHTLDLDGPGPWPHKASHSSHRDRIATSRDLPRSSGGNASLCLSHSRLSGCGFPAVATRARSSLPPPHGASTRRSSPTDSPLAPFPFAISGGTPYHTHASSYSRPSAPTAKLRPARCMKRTYPPSDLRLREATSDKKDTSEAGKLRLDRPLASS
jgi:hypothetical protein